jgi:hypothetical protein
MDEGDYHFDRILSYALTEGGKYIIVYVKGAAEGAWGLRIPVLDVPGIVAKLFSIAGEGNRKSGEKALRPLAIQEVKVIDSPTLGEHRTILSVTFENGSPPLAMDLPRSGLVEIARLILQSEGEIPTADRSSPIQ